MDNNELEKATGLLPSATPLPPRRAWVIVDDEEQGGLVLRDILNQLFKHRALIIVLVVLSLLAAPVAYRYLSSKYEASATLMIRFGKEYAGPKWTNDPSPLHMGLPEIANSEIAILRSGDLLEKVIHNLWPEFAGTQGTGDSPQEERQVRSLVAGFQKNLTVQSVADSNLLKLSFFDSNPRRAADALNQLVDSYMEKRIEILGEQESTLWLEKKVKYFAAKVKESQEKLKPLQDPNETLTFDERRSALVKDRATLDTTLGLAQAQVKEATKKLASLESQRKDLPTLVPPTEAVVMNPLETELYSLERSRRDLLVKYREDNPLVRRAEAEIEIMKTRLEEWKKNKKPMQVNGPMKDFQKEIVTAKAELEGLHARNEELKRQRIEIDRKLQELEAQEKTIRSPRDELAANEESYRIYSKKLEEARVADDMFRQKLTSISVVERATVPLFPLSPRLKLVPFVLAAGFLGLCVGAGISLLIEFARQGFFTAEKAQNTLGLTVIADFPYRR